MALFNKEINLKHFQVQILNCNRIEPEGGSMIKDRDFVKKSNFAISQKRKLRSS